MNFSKTVVRRYRHARRALRLAAQSWRNRGDIDVVLQLGDFMDLSNARLHDPVAIENTFRDLLDDLKTSNSKEILHLIGNHDLCLFKKQKLLSLLSMEDKGNFYEYCPHPGWRLICLDGYAISTLGNGVADNDTNSIAEKILDENNPNPWREPRNNFLRGLKGPSKRFVPFNGAFGSTQLAWLSSRLNFARSRDECVIVCSHLPVLPSASIEKYICLAWDYEEVLKILSETNANVLAFLAGHDHSGGYNIQQKNDGKLIHHLTLRGVVETKSDECHATIVFSREPGSRLGTLQVFGAGALDSIQKSVVI